MSRVILCLLHLPPPHIGPSVINESVIQSLSLNPEFECDVFPINTSNHIQQINRFSLKKVSVLFTMSFKLIRRLLNRKYHLVYMSLTPTGIGFLKDFILVMILKMRGVCRLYHLHGKGVHEKQNVFMTWLYRLCFKGSHVILLSESLYPDIKCYVPREQVSVIPNGVPEDIDAKAWEKIRERRRQPHVFHVLFLANLVRSKGIFTALEAVRQLQQKELKFQFSVVGADFDVTQAELVEWVEQNDLQETVFVLGYRSGAQKREIFERADIFIYPTQKDTFPLVLLEAMQYGLPVVSTFEGAIPDIVDANQTGFLVAPGSATDLAEKIEFLMKDTEWRSNMGEQARAKFVREYTFFIFEHRLSAVFKKVSDDRAALS